MAFKLQALVYVKNTNNYKQAVHPNHVDGNKLEQLHQVSPSMVYKHHGN